MFRYSGRCLDVYRNFRQHVRLLLNSYTKMSRLPVSDIHKRGEKLKRVEEKLERSFNGRNLELLLEFENSMKAQNMSKSRLCRYLSSFNAIADLIDFNLDTAEKKDLIKLVGRINQNEISGQEERSAWTLNEYRKAIRRFYRWYKNADEPEIIDFISCNVKKKNRSKVDVDELPRPTDVETLKNHMANPRDKAFIVTLWECGGRISEVLNLQWQDIQHLEEFSKLKIRESKTQQRSVPVKDCVPLLENWKLQHPDPSEGEYIFTKLDRIECLKQVSYRGMQGQMRSAEGKADLPDRIKTNFHAFRKSRAHYLANHGFNIFQLMAFFGWDDPETAMPYVLSARKSLNDAFLRVYRQSQLDEFERSGDSLGGKFPDSNKRSQEQEKQPAEAFLDF